MSETIRQQYVEARADQLTRNEARRIRTRVNEARKGSHDAGMRWPFELLQNALDAGPRTGRTEVCVTLSACDDAVVFEHDGAPFSLQDLAALLSGGSSKEFESEEKTGRFGTGFLVTHVLSEHTEIRGVISGGDVFEKFALTLDRGGDESAILANIRRCERDLDNATPISEIDGEPSAWFKYVVDGESQLSLGLDAFCDSLPYLYATRPSLGRVKLSHALSGVSQWTPANARVVDLGAGKGCLTERQLHVVHGDDSPGIKYRVLRFQLSVESRAACIVLLIADGNGWRLCVPGDSLPRVYREYPIRGSHFVPTTFVFDGKFDVTQERDRVAMTDDDKRLFEEAFEATSLAIACAATEEWRDRHQLCRFAPIRESFTRTDDEVRWWNSLLKKAAESVARMPIVATPRGYGPVVEIAGGGWFADFPMPRLDSVSKADETTLDRLWPLVNEVTSLYPPLSEVAVAWRNISNGWSALGVEVNDVCVRRLGEYVRSEVTELGELKVTTDRYEWIARFIDIVGECWKTRGGTDPHVLDSLLPNQKGQLKSPHELGRDDGLSQEIKDISEDLGVDARKVLLDQGIVNSAVAPTLKYLEAALQQAIPHAITEVQVFNDLVAHLDKTLLEGERLPKDGSSLIAGTIRLLDYIGRVKGPGGAPLAKKLPLLTADGKITRFASERQLMAPVSHWDTRAQPFVEAYPTARVLAAHYVGNETEKVPSVVKYLIAWGIAIADPLHIEAPAELKERGLHSIALDPDEATRVVVSVESFPQIALLRSAILNRVEFNSDAAKSLLGLVLCYIAVKDGRWRCVREVKGRKDSADVLIRVRDSLWISDLRSRNWVLHVDEHGESSNVPADRHSLGPLLDPKWLEGNEAAIQLLSECFDFDALDLRLLGVAPSEAERKLLRDGLARLVETAGADPTTYDVLRQELLSKAKRERDVNRCRRIGFAIQEAIRCALASRGLHIEVIDRGFDFAVGTPAVADLDDLDMWFEVGAELIEIKSTRTGDACMTPTQARTAASESHRYTLCVVDLRDVDDARLDLEWTGEDVVPLARMVSSVGETIKATRNLVVAACVQPIGIRNDSALRYNASPVVWEPGCSIDAWVAERFA